MKKRLFSLLLIVVIAFLLSVIPVSAKEDYAYNHFMAVVKEEFSVDLEKTVATLDFYNAERIDIISEPDSSQGVLVIWLTTDSEEGFNEAYAHFGKKECVDRLIKSALCGEPDTPTEDEITENVCLSPFDTDGDGKVTASDARLVLRAAVGLETFTENQKRALGLEKDDAVSAADARKVLRISVGLEEILVLIAYAEN